MVRKNFEDKVRSFFLNNNDIFRGCPDINLFRYLGNENFKYKNSNVLDIGFGDFENLELFLKKKSKISGIDINNHKLKYFNKLYNLKKNQLQCIDLNFSFPSFGVKKFDLIYSIDTVYYLSDERINDLIYFVEKTLKKNGIFVFQFVQKNIEYKPGKNYLSYNISSSYKNAGFINNKNPIRLLKENKIKDLIFKSNLHLYDSFFAVSNYLIKNKKKRILRINRYIVLKKK